ncbi:MAG TPA: hypothetical protein DDZ96_05035 [Porphyromonadaceae bacterium]|jgi:hypothetical protein|nr:hypothetical protein [Porphyromonadaceae bacterium]HBX21136.1 hypothetical protein [Porphyromonadaceae bacterium]HCM21596.1 hypothetical protein [Porphyromonadaceae bacterium]
MLRISFGKLSTKGLGDFARHVLTALGLRKETILKDSPLVTDLEEKNGRYTKVVIKKIYSDLGDAVGEADLLRDRLYRGVRRILNGLLPFKGTAKGKAAATLLAVFEEVGDIEGLSYGDENTVLDKLVEKLSSEENTALIAEVGITDEVAAMKKAQEDFKTLKDVQADADSSLRQMSSASSIRHELEDSLRNIFAYISGMRNVGEWSDLYYDLNQLIKEAHQSNRENKDEKDEKLPDK